MSLTPEEEEELRQLQELDRELRDRHAGQQAISTVRTGATRRATPRPFSLYRATIGGLRDAAQGAIDTVLDLRVSMGNAMASLTGTDPSLETQAISMIRRDGLAELPQLEGSSEAGLVENLSRGVMSFAVPYVGAARMLGVTRASSFLGRAGRAMLAGGAVDFAQVDPVSGNAANLLRDVFGLDNAALDALAGSEDDDMLANRFRAAVVNAPVGLAADAIMEAGIRAVRAYRSWRGTREEAEEIVRVARTDPTARPEARNLRREGEEQTISWGDEPPGARAARPRPAQAANDDSAGGSGYDRMRHAVRETPPETFDDVLGHLQAAASGLDVDTELPAAKALVDALLGGDPENALAKLGVDPARLDFSVYDDPERLAHLLNGLTDVQTAIAGRLGRTGIRVTEAATAGAARALATTADVLQRIYGSTANLAEQLTASRLFVGAHAHRLLASADAALAEIAASGAGPAWQQFLSDFHRHAYYVGTVRGASSEVGRALRSLKIIGKVDKPRAAAELEEAIQAENLTRGAGNDVQRGASEFIDGLVTDAERIEAINRVRATKGDVGEIARFTRTKNLSVLRRIDAGLKETVGNLFSTSTAILNVASGGLMLGLRGTSKLLASVSRAALSPFGRQHAVAARVHLMDAWAYTDGIISGFRDAWGASLAVLEKEGMAEAALNLDGMGLERLAKRAAERSTDAETRLSAGNYERTEVKNHRALAVSASELDAIRARLEPEDGPTFLSRGLMAGTRVLATGVNLVGSLSRAGTTAFINMPDQFVGSLTARAGARSHAVRLAASEAAELGLEGADLSRFLKARTQQLTATAGDGWHPDPWDAGKREAAASHGDAEAREVLFQDDLEWGPNRSLAHALSEAPLMHLIVPFVKTPLRILERTAIDFTPIGLVKGAHLKALATGGPAADEARARMALGMIAMATAFQFGDELDIVGNDGSFRSSARVAGRPSYSLRVGDDIVEFNRVDPIGILLGFGADMRQYLDHADGDPEAAGNAQLMLEAMFWSITTNVLSKTWLTSIRSIAEAAATTEEGESALSRALISTAARFTPASGVQRSIGRAADGWQREADSFIDAMIRSSVGASTLPVRRDGLLGRPIEFGEGSRLVGAPVRISQDGDRLMAELENLSFDIPRPRRTIETGIEDVRMNAAQYSRYLELRGQVSRDPGTGLTLEESLRSLIALPEYLAMGRDARVDQVRQQIEGYHRLALDQLLQEDAGLRYRVLRAEVYDTLELRGASREQKDAEVERLARELGVPLPTP